MSVTTKLSADGLTKNIIINGSFDFHVQKEFRFSYEDAEASVKAYIVDMHNVTYLDSSALGMLLLLHDFAGGDDSKIDIIGAIDSIKELLEIAGFGKFFKII